MSDRLTLADIARELDISRHQAAKLVQRYHWLARAVSTEHGVTYSPQFLDALAAMRGEPHRSIEPPYRDWLATYRKEIPCPPFQVFPSPAPSPAPADETPAS